MVKRTWATNFKGGLTSVKIKWLIAFFVLSACVQEIDFDIPSEQLLTIVEGFISDSPGPYIIKVSKGLRSNATASTRVPYSKVKIKLFDDQGNVENLLETEPGIYQTGGVIQGKIGRSYSIKLETPNGNIFQSEPDRINAVGVVEKIKFDFEARTAVNPFGEVKADVFNIYVDANAGTGSDNYLRWRFTGTYKVVNNPELHMTYIQGYTPYNDPHPCSGYIYTYGVDGAFLQQREECTCCVCWAKHFESQPQLSDVQFVSNNQFKNIKIAEVPIGNTFFSDKYLVEVDQMSLSRTAFEFFRLVRLQKEGASSLFQPPSGEIKGNVKPVNNDQPVVGLFWATSISSKSIYLYKSDIPYPLPPKGIDTRPCTELLNSSTQKPPLWN